MSVEIDKLLALKAFYMGHAIAEKKTNKAPALSMVDAAIEHLRKASNPPEKMRLAFYHLLRAEILRHETTPLADRQEAKQICQEIGSSLYDHFMAIENATQGTKELDGIQTLYVVDEGIKRTASYWVTDGWNSWAVRYDIASHALGVDERSFTEKQRKFLERATLKDMLDKHGVDYTP